jgi:ribosomal protein S27AE
MPKDNTAENQRILSEPLYETSGYCPQCRNVVFFMADKDRGYYKQCPSCGHAEHLNRRTLKFDKQSRQWL